MRDTTEEMIRRINYHDHILDQTLTVLREMQHESLFRRLIYAFRPTMFPRFKKELVLRPHVVSDVEPHTIPLPAPEMDVEPVPESIGDQEPQTVQTAVPRKRQTLPPARKVQS